jgi:hypothetical protein
MNTTPRRARARRNRSRSASLAHSQRFGRITDRKPSGSGPTGRQGTYFVRDDEPGATYSFNYADIVTERFRTIRTGERVRFLTDPDRRRPCRLRHPPRPAGCRRVLQVTPPDVPNLIADARKRGRTADPVRRASCQLLTACAHTAISPPKDRIHARRRMHLRSWGFHGTRLELAVMPMSGSCTPVHLCSFLHIANVGGARQFSLMSLLSGRAQLRLCAALIVTNALRAAAGRPVMDPVLSVASLTYRRWLALPAALRVNKPACAK